MQRINNDIKQNQFQKVYLLFGEERYLKKQYTDRLKKALGAESDSINVHFYEGKELNVGEIIDLAETMPFLAEPVGPTIRTSPRGCEIISLMRSRSSGVMPSKSRFKRLSSKLNRRKTASSPYIVGTASTRMFSRCEAPLRTISFCICPDCGRMLAIDIFARLLSSPIKIR